VPFGATAAARANSTAEAAFLGGYGAGGTLDTGTERLWDGPFFAPAEGTLDGWLLGAWAGGAARYDALFLQNLTSADTVPHPSPLCS
jgi:hypothetical protein